MNKVLVCLTLFMLMLAPPTIASNYSFAINAKNWCWVMGNSGGSYAHFIYLKQIVGDYAIFMGSGVKIAINKDQIGGELYQDRTLYDSVTYIGKVGTLTGKTRQGFPLEVEHYEVIDKYGFYNTPNKTGVTNTDCQ